MAGVEGKRRGENRGRIGWNVTDARGGLAGKKISEVVEGARRIGGQAGMCAGRARPQDWHEIEERV